MKTLIAALLLVSTSAFAQSLDATEALLATLAAGEYRGVTPAGQDCDVSVRVLSGKVAVVASDANLTKRSEVAVGASYRWKPGIRSFLSTVFVTTLQGSTENIIRTIAVTENTQYVVVADLIRNSQGSNETKVECIINL